MSNEEVIQMTDADFHDVINTGITLVDFWAQWCAPCLMQGPIIEKVGRQFKGRAKVAKVNIDVNPASASRFGIRGIPTLILFKDGQEIERFVGVQMEEVLVKVINENLPSQAEDTFVKA